MTVPRKAQTRALAVPLALAMLGSPVPIASAAPPSPAPARTPTAPAGMGGELSGDESGGALAHNTCKKQPPGTKFRLTLPKEAELEALVNWMMSVSCQKFIYDPALRTKKVTILSPEAVTLQEAYAAFYAALETMGATVEPSGEYFRIVETSDAISKTLPVYGPDSRAPSNARFVTQLYRVSGNVSEITPLLEQLKSKSGNIQTVGDLVIITDTGTNVQRMLEIVRQIDDPELAGEKVYFYQLQNANASEIAETIREIFGEKSSNQPSSRSKRSRRNARANTPTPAQTGETAAFSRVVLDERTNTLIIVAEEDDYQVIRRLIEQLDVQLAGGGGRIHVVKLKNADPEQVAQVLTQLGSGAQQAAQRTGAARQGAQANQAQPGGTTAELFSGEVKVTADPATRSLVILSSNNDFNALRKVIDELDVERKSVYMEVYLLELNVNNELEAGTGGHFGAGFDAPGGRALGFVSAAPTQGNSSLLLDPSVLTGLAAGVIGPQIPNSGALLGLNRDIPAFGVIIQALQTSSDVNFVAQPHLFAADNQEAVIEVGRQVPTPGALSFPGGGAGGGLVPVQSIQRQDVTLRVQVTPHVNDGDMVTLDIELENNDIESIDPVRGVTTTKRRVKLDKVLARDDQPVVLGGLLQEVERQTTNKVPLLGDIPLLGWLFKNKQRQRIKVNLMMILVPHILETPDDVRRIHERRMRERLEFLEASSFKHRDLDYNINYRRKAGLLSAINDEAARMIEEETFRRRAELELQGQSVTGEIGLSPRAYEEGDEEDAGLVPPPASSRSRRNQTN